MTMTEQVSHAYMARVFIAQAQAKRHLPSAHALLMKWAADRRQRHAEALRVAAAPPVNTTPVQGDLFEGLFS
jgi:hypothetical protein